MPDGSAHAKFTIGGYKPDHLRRLALQPDYAFLRGFIEKTNEPERILDAGPSWTAWASGEPIACGGFREIWAGRAEAWAIVSPLAAAYTIPLVRAVRAGIASHPAERIEATTDAGHPAAGHFALACGFTPEGIALRYCRGLDHQRWVILKSGLTANLAV
jgi:hypothetical protein